MHLQAVQPVSYTHLNEVYTYERCSLTTVGVVTGATTNMYL